MKRLLIGLIVLGAFVGGYQLGQRPNSPDLKPYAVKTYNIIAAAGERLARAAGDKSQPPAENLAAVHR